MTRKRIPKVSIGVIGGSGFYSFEGVRLVKEIAVKTPFGFPSEKIALVEAGGVFMAFLARHGKGHRILPTEINNRANIYAMKLLGIESLIGVGAAGSLREELAPKHLVVPDQLVDKTRLRAQTFFGAGIVAHVAFDKPFCPRLSSVLVETARGLGFEVHQGGVSVTMEGPAFSTLAESLENRNNGYSLIGMTAAPEAKLAREAGICYSSLAFVTDYDCWKQGEEVTLEKILENLQEGSLRAAKTVMSAAPLLAGAQRDCSCAKAQEHAIVTDRKKIPAAIAKKLAPIIGKYL